MSDSYEKIRTKNNVLQLRPRCEKRNRTQVQQQSKIRRDKQTLKRGFENASGGKFGNKQQTISKHKRS